MALRAGEATRSCRFENGCRPFLVQLDQPAAPDGPIPTETFGLGFDAVWRRLEALLMQGMVVGARRGRRRRRRAELVGALGGGAKDTQEDSTVRVLAACLPCLSGNILRESLGGRGDGAGRCRCNEVRRCASPAREHLGCPARASDAARRMWRSELLR